MGKIMSIQLLTSLQSGHQVQVEGARAEVADFFFEGLGIANEE
jgi:hypothetical protein